jgi:hypothetical protein
MNGSPAANMAPIRATDTRSVATMSSGGHGEAPSATNRTMATNVKIHSWLNREAFDAARRRPDAGQVGNIHYIVLASDTDNNSVDIYQDNTYEPQNPNQPMIGQLAINGPVGLAVDAATDIFAVSGTDEAIYEYTSASYPKPALTIPDANNPEGIAVGYDGTVYAADNYGGVSEYKKGATTAFKTLSLPSGDFPEYVALDKSNDVYVGDYNPNDGRNELGYFKGGNPPFVVIPLANQAYQPKLDENGDLFVENDATGNIDFYPNGSLSPTRSIPLTNDDYGFFDLDYAQKNVFSEAGYSGYVGTSIYQYTNPGASLVDTITQGNYLFGIVTIPAAPYPPAYVPPSS